MPEALPDPCRILLLAPPGCQPPEDGRTVLVRTGCQDLVRHAPVDALLLWLPDAGPLDAWLAALADWPGALPPALAVVPGASLAQRQRGFELGLQLWLEAPPPDAAALRAQLQWAAWQARRHAQLLGRLDDRIWTERAKGLLMSAREIDEDSAFRLLREAAMHAQLRLAEVARSVVQAAQLAEGVNLAGQQRMLSQRLVKLVAQRAAGIEAKRAKVLQDESAARIEANLARLPALLPASLDIAGLSAAWVALRPLLSGKPTAAVLLQADAAA